MILFLTANSLSTIIKKTFVSNGNGDESNLNAERTMNGCCVQSERAVSKR